MTAASYVTDYHFMKRMNDGLVGLSSSHGQQLFTLNKLRKPKPCALCKIELQPKQRAYAPITNGYNRMHRICVACVAELEAEFLRNPMAIIAEDMLKRQAAAPPMGPWYGFEPGKKKT